MAQKRLYDIWRQIAQCALARLTQEPGPLVKAAFELLKGNLPELPNNIVLSTRLEYLNERALAHAISPNGKIAILMARDEMTCGLVTWSQEEGLREQNLDNLWHYTEELPMGVLFPNGSEDPLVYYGEDHEDGDLHHIRWGEYHHQQCGSTNIAEVSACIEEDLLCITFRLEENYTLLRYNPDTKSSLETIRTKDHLLYTWFGCIDGKVARIRRHGFETLYWHGGKVEMPDEAHKIDVDTICSAPNVGVWFVSRTEESGVEYLWWSNGIETKCTENYDEPVSREGILLIRPESGKVFVEEKFHPLKMHEHVLFQRNSSGAESEAQITSPIWRVILRPGSYPFSKLGVFAGKRSRSPSNIQRGKITNKALLLQDHWKDELLVYALASGVRTKIFPMHGDYFHTLGVVRKGNRVYILGFHLVGSTLHIIRYLIV